MFIHSPIGRHLGYEFSLHGRYELLFGPSLALVIIDNDPKDQQVSLSSSAQIVMEIGLFLDDTENVRKWSEPQRNTCKDSNTIQTHTHKRYPGSLSTNEKMLHWDTISCPSELSRNWQDTFLVRLWGTGILIHWWWSAKCKETCKCLTGCIYSSPSIPTSRIHPKYICPQIWNKYLQCYSSQNYL